MNPGLHRAVLPPETVADTMVQSGLLSLKFHTQSQNSPRGAPKTQYQWAGVGPHMSPLLTVSSFLFSTITGLRSELEEGTSLIHSATRQESAVPSPHRLEGEMSMRYPSGYEWAQHRHLETHRFETEAVYLMIRLNLLLGFLSAGKILINNKTNFGFLILSKEVKKRLLQDDNVYAVYLEFLCSLTPFNY